MKTWTVDEMLAEYILDPRVECQIESAWPGRATVSLLEIVEEFPLSDFHRLVIALKPGVLAPQVRNQWGLFVSRRALTRALCMCGEVPVCNVSGWRDWARKWIMGDRKRIFDKHSYPLMLPTSAHCATEAVLCFSNDRMLDVSCFARRCAEWAACIGAGDVAEEDSQQVQDLLALRGEWAL